MYSVYIEWNKLFTNLVGRDRVGALGGARDGTKYTIKKERVAGYTLARAAVAAAIKARSTPLPTRTFFVSLRGAPLLNPAQNQQY